MKKLLVMLCVLLWTPQSAWTAAMAAADNADGYSGTVLEKVSRLWSPPHDAADRKVRIRISIDGSGKVLACEPVASSALAAMDKSACAAVREAAKFGTPPYGLPITVFMTLWTGTPKGADKIPAPQAQAGVDKGTGKPSATQQMNVPADKPESAETKYVNAVMHKISPNVVIPAKLPDGKYRVVVMVRVDGRGQVTQVQLERSGGNAELDNAIMRAVSKTAKVGAPPNKGTLDLNLTFVVQKP